MSRTKSTSMFVIATVLLAAIVPRGNAAIGCGVVVSYLSPCTPYVTGNRSLGGCCDGLKGLGSAATTTADRQSVCNCVKSLSGSYSRAAISRASGLAGQCGIILPCKFSPSTDCSKVT